MPLDEWQEQALEAAMGERTDGRWASKFVGVSAPRQNGKSQLIVARALAGAMLFGEKMIIISAHETDTAREIWKRLIDVIEANPSLEKRLTGRMDAINREFVAFGKGSERQTIKLKARRASGSRGFSADCLLLDEAQILGKQSWGSIVPTMSAMPNPQMWLFGTPPTAEDDPFAFSRVRDSAIAKKARHCWLEWSADEDDDFDDPEIWAKANPAYGIRISYEACADDRAAMDSEQFGRERLGMWSAGATQSVIDPLSWDAVKDPASMAIERLSLGVSATPDRAFASVSLAGQRADELWHVEVDEQRGGIAWTIKHVADRCAKNKIRSVVIDATDPAVSLVDDFKKAGVTVTVTTTREAATAFALVYDGVTDTRDVKHINQPQLNVALSLARARKLQLGKVWDPLNSLGDITPVTSMTSALWGAKNTTVKKPTRKRSGERRAVVV